MNGCARWCVPETAAEWALSSGRSVQIKKQLSESLLAVIKDLCEWPTGVEVQLCVEILDIDRESYAKTTVGV